MLLNLQLADAENMGLAKYKRKTAAHYMKHVRFDGIPETEVTSNGDDSAFSSGFGSDGTNMVNQRSGGYKLLNMITRGEQYVFNYFGRNIEVGGLCFAIVKKFGPEIPEFKLCPKQNVAGFASQSKAGVSLVGANTQKIKPYMMTFVCLPKGGALTPDHLRYIDEDGHERFDAYTIFLGTLARIPVDHIYKDVATSVELKPFTDSFQTYDQNESRIMLPNIILDSNDGCDPFPY
jgi:hypothetical protein